ncbi:nuclear transport factor 2 family protein [Actinacidiphila acidipaludis]|uniref:Nuclear transport factor 2 family protein n=1 Tax=Actinacidiphila acidipaludis TaxID=2873382 RepID=A0ABS7Q7U5_9ACTN|nr:nuclear transport factor 2 family protein [Streptomyces acidipaludis]MBY8879230.1 nuclear transport factor 2 family protein [Streptomyces acidipaludis]
MEHPHITLIRKGYDAFSRGDMDTLRTLLTSDCTHHVPGSSPMSGDFKGIEAVLGYYGKLAEQTGGTFKVELQNVLTDGRGHVMAFHRASAERDGRTLDAMEGIVFRIIGEKVTDIDECVEDLDVVDAFWS